MDRRTRSASYPTGIVSNIDRAANKSGVACVINADGSYATDALHEQMTAGVDDSDIRARTRAKLRVRDVPAAALNGLFPDLPPLPIESDRRSDSGFM
jgi:hypothetical protein